MWSSRILRSKLENRPYVSPFYLTLEKSICNLENHGKAYTQETCDELPAQWNISSMPEYEISKNGIYNLSVLY